MSEMLRRLAGAAAALALLGAGGAGAADLSAVPAGPYRVDADHGYIHFTYSHLGFSNPVLRFGAFSVDLDLDTARLENSSFEVVIDAASIDSGVERFDGHLRGPDFFDVAEHPTIVFRSTAVTGQPGGGLIIDGDLTIRGITRPVRLLGRINRAAVGPVSERPTVGVSATASVKRSDWRLDSYVPAVSDEVEIMIEVELQAR